MRSKRPCIQIRMKILRLLKKLPMTRYELSVMVKTNPETIERHLDYLQLLDKVESYQIPELDKELWIIKKKR